MLKLNSRQLGQGALYSHAKIIKNSLFQLSLNCQMLFIFFVYRKTHPEQNCLSVTEGASLHLFNVVPTPIFLYNSPLVQVERLGLFY